MKRCECAESMQFGDDVPEWYTGAWVVPASAGLSIDEIMALTRDQHYALGHTPLHAQYCSEDGAGEVLA